MSQTFSLNNSKDIICDALFLLDTNNTLQNVLDLIANSSGGGGGSGGITTLTGTGAAIITGTSTSKNIMVDLSMYSTSTQMNTLLNSKQDNLTAGTNITISNNTISSSGSLPLILQLNGITQTATTLNFVENNALLSGGVLNVSRLTHYDKIPLICSTTNTIKDITQDVNSNLLWGTDILTTTNALNTALLAYPTLVFFQGVLNNYTDTGTMLTLLNAKVDDSQVLTNVPLNALFTDTIYSKPAYEPISYITGLQTALNAKQDTLTAGTNITISNNTISATSGGAPLILQLDGVNQTATTLNFIQNNAVLSGGILNVSRLTHYDKIPLIYSTTATIKDITQDSSSNLLWGTDILTTNTYLTNVLASYATTASLSSYSTTAQMTTLLNGKVDDSQVLTNVPLNAVFTDTLYTHPSQHSISMITGLQTALNAKQDTLTAGNNITISSNTISAIADATQAWVTANFLSPLNQGTVGVTAGLSSTMTANTFIISVDQNFDRRNLFILEDANHVLRNITTNTAGNLLYDNINLATEPYVTTQLATKQDTLDYYSESGTGETTILQGLDTLTPVSIHIAWSGTYTNVSGSHQIIPVGGVNGVSINLHTTTTNGLGGGTILMTCDLRGVGSCTECAFTTSNYVSWSGAPETVITGLNTSTFTSVTWSFPLPANQLMNFVVGNLPPGSSLSQTTGDIHLRNFRLYRVSGLATISNNISIAGDAVFGGSVTATGYSSTSDSRIKENIEDVDANDAMLLLKNVNAKTYQRTDTGNQSRIGFIADDWYNNTPSKFGNIWSIDYNTGLLQIDYSRIGAVLWSCCQEQQAMIEQLTERVKLLETPVPKAKKTKATSST